MSEARRDGRMRKRLLVSLVTLVLLLTVAETLARLFPAEDALRTRAGTVEPDPDLLWRLKPERDGPLATNELGLRDDPFRADADVKILLLGDSVAWGDGIASRKACFPWLLERELERATPGRSYEVINAAVPGYATFQERGWLERYGLALQPDLVLLEFCLNDVTERYKALAQYGGDESFLGINTRRAMPGLHGFLARHSDAYYRVTRLVQRYARHEEEYNVKGLTDAQWSTELEHAWSTTMAEIDGLRALAAEHHIPLLVVLMPYRFQLNDPARLRRPQDRLAEFLTRLDVPSVDLLLELARANEREPVFRDQNHLSESGHAVVAPLLAPHVLRALDARR